MALYSPQGDFSDDEIFFGKLTIKEVKKHISSKNHRQSISCATENNKLNASEDSVKVIETHSEPDIYSVRDDSLNFECNSSFPVRPSTDCNVQSTDDSFLKLEKMVTEMCVKTKNNSNEELNNTLEVIDFILKNTPHKGGNDEEAGNKNEENHVTTVEIHSNSKTDDIDFKDTNLTDGSIDEFKTRIDLQIEKLYDSPLKKPLKADNILNAKTPLTNKPAKDIFKTPKNPVPIKNCVSSTKKTPGRLQAFQHITSPVASYIKNCPQVPLLKDVRPKKPLPNCSSIPKLVKNTCEKNKENIALPSIAYKSAKKTKMITIPDKEKLPQNAWANKIARSLQKPVIIRHDHRENNKSSKKIIGNQKDDSFANLSLHQADLSVCTQKSAVSTPQI